MPRTRATVRRERRSRERKACTGFDSSHAHQTGNVNFFASPRSLEKLQKNPLKNISSSHVLGKEIFLN